MHRPPNDKGLLDYWFTHWRLSRKTCSSLSEGKRTCVAAAQSDWDSKHMLVPRTVVTLVNLRRAELEASAPHRYLELQTFERRRIRDMSTPAAYDWKVLYVASAARGHIEEE